ncbi:MAG: hypothetical protein WDW38_006713 [Sanguina aurantia]
MPQPQTQTEPAAVHGTGDYHLPSEAGGKECRTEKAHKYSIPKSDVKGVAIATGIIIVWALLFHHGLFHVKLGGEAASSVLHIVAVFASLEFMCTGLFITCHDAMHGTVAYRNRKLNDFIGWVAISCYALFDYRMLHRKHWLHHNHTGEVKKDPDFHTGNPNFLVWFASFMVSYSSVMQFVKLGTAANVLQFLGAPFNNVLLFMTAAPVIAALRLFYFGTYLPHLPRAASDVMGWQLSHSSNVSSWQSFFTCFHFDYHWEHHRWPYAPWWELDKCKAITALA